MSLDNLKPVLEEYAQLKMAANTAIARMKELDVQIRPVLDGRGKVTAGGFSFDCKSMPGRKTFDKKAAEEAGYDLSPFYKTGKPFTTLTVKEIENV